MAASRAAQQQERRLFEDSLLSNLGATSSESRHFPDRPSYVLKVASTVRLRPCVPVCSHDRLPRVHSPTQSAVHPSPETILVSYGTTSDSTSGN